MPMASPELDLDSIEKLREEELDEARATQSGMLPTQPLRVGGITISHEFQPATLVGGDYLDYFSLPDGMIGMYVGDVSGKGRPGHVCGAGGRNTQGRPQYGTASDPGDGSLEQETAAPREPLQIYRYPALLDPITAQLHLSSAGMPGRMLLRAGECRVLKVAGIPPGLFPEINYDHLTLQLEPGNSLLFYTDGLIDARNTQQAECETEGPQQVCGSH